jgi:dTDP-4-dehydrorhamnose reductase
MNRVALALRVLKYFPNANYDLIPLSTAALQQAAARPLLGGFISSKFHQLYPEFLFSTVDDYMQKQIID